MWAHDENGKPVPVEGRDMGENERMEEPRFDPVLHQRHACVSWLKAVRGQVGAEVTISRDPVHGTLLAADGDYLAVRIGRNRVALQPLGTDWHVEVGADFDDEPVAQDHT